METARPPPENAGSAYYEHVFVPPEQTFLWRKDDYPWRRCVWNYHPAFEIHLIRHSSGLAYVGDSIATFEPGYLALIGGNLPHNWITPSAGNQKLVDRDIVVQFDPERLLNSAHDLPELAGINELFSRASLGLEFRGETARFGAAILEGLGELQGLVALGRFFELLDLMAKSKDFKVLASEKFLKLFKPGSQRDAEKLEQALHHIQTNFLSGLTRKEVADLVGMSESAFSRFFKTQTGNNFSDHVSILKIWTACKLLAESETPITDLCFEAGFNNISNFNRTFLRYTNFTPSRYRRAANGRRLRYETVDMLP